MGFAIAVRVVVGRRAIALLLERQDVHEALVGLLRLGGACAMPTTAKGYASAPAVDNATVLMHRISGKMRTLKAMVAAAGEPTAFRVSDLGPRPP